MASSGGRLARTGFVLGLAAAIGAAGCSSGKQSSAAGSQAAQRKSGTITIAYLQKQGDQQYFVDEANGAKAEAAELGNVQVVVADLGTDANKAINAVTTEIGQKVDGMAIVVPDQKIGPQVLSATSAAGIPVVASDDPIQDGSGKPAPFVGFDSVQMGTAVGQEAGKLFKQAGWSAADTKILAAYKQDLSDCQLREQGEEAGFTQTAGATVPAVKVGTDNSVVDAQNKTSAVLTANPGVKHWVVWGCNDESETGAVTGLQNGGVAPASIIGVGLGAYLTCKDWRAGQQTGNKASLFIGGKDVGAASVKVLVDKIRNGVELPPKTIAKTTMVDPKTWQQAGVECT
jgi:L-arabinose transport system substrate-binding protein